MLEPDVYALDAAATTLLPRQPTPASQRTESKPLCPFSWSRVTIFITELVPVVLVGEQDLHTLYVSSDQEAAAHSEPNSLPGGTGLQVTEDTSVSVSFPFSRRMASATSESNVLEHAPKPCSLVWGMTFPGPRRENGLKKKHFKAFGR